MSSRRFPRTAEGFAQQALWFVFALACAPPALAQVPDPSCSTLPCGITLVGLNAGVPDPAGEFTVVARDLACNPIAGASLVFDFSECAPDLRVCADQAGAGPVNCVGPLVHATTGALSAR